MSDIELEETSSLDQLRWIAWAQQKAGEEWVRERDLTHLQAFVLGYLVQNPGAIQRDIAAMGRTTAANVSMMLQGLERRGLLERRSEPGNERSKRVYATEAGGALIDGFAEAMTAAYTVILEPLSAEEQAVLHALLTKVTARLPRPTRS